MSDDTWVPYADQTQPEDPEPTPEPTPAPELVFEDLPQPEPTPDERLLAAGWRKVNGAWER